jgi:hypothetical protein
MGRRQFDVDRDRKISSTYRSPAKMAPPIAFHAQSFAGSTGSKDRVMSMLNRMLIP